MRRLWTVLAALATLSLTNCGYIAIQTNDEQVKSAWSEVLNQYQRRADLVPNLVNSVKGFAQQEKDVLLGVTNARARSAAFRQRWKSSTIPARSRNSGRPGRTDQRAVEASGGDREFPAAQIRRAVSRSDVAARRHRNRITVARNRYIKAVQDYNVGIRTFPNNLTAMAFGYKEKANFTVDNEKEISTAPKVDFNPAPAPAK